MKPSKYRVTYSVDGRPARTLVGALVYRDPRMFIFVREGSRHGSWIQRHWIQNMVRA